MVGRWSRMAWLAGLENVTKLDNGTMAKGNTTDFVKRDRGPRLTESSQWRGIMNEDG